MRRQNLLVSPGRGVARKDRRRSQRGDDYDIDVTPAAVEMEAAGLFKAEKEPAADPSSAKSVYRETARALNKFLATWGRVQQREEQKYEQLVEQAQRRVSFSLTEDKETVLEEFDGVLDKLVGDVAHVTLTTKTGEKFFGEYPASALLREGVRENRRFKCWTIEHGVNFEFRVEAVPDNELTQAREEEISRMLDKALGDDNAQQDDY